MSDPRNDDATRDWLGESGAARDPIKAVRAQGKAPLPKRFYREAAVREEDGGVRLILDGRPANTPARRPLFLPTRALGERVAAEWAAQEDVIDPARMPLTRLVNSAIDGVAERREAVLDDLRAYAGTDLVAYRAADPERLVAAQAQAWDPIVAWAREALGARLILSEGVMHVAQPDATIDALDAAAAQEQGPFRLAALHTMTTLTGSLLIALAVLRGQLTPEQGWAAAHVDDRFQASVWGGDGEAEFRLANRKAEFEAAATVGALAD